MNNPKDGPEQFLPGPQKQDDVSGEGKALTIGPGPGVSALKPTHQHGAASAQGIPIPAPPRAAGQDDDGVDPMARLTEIVSQTTARSAEARIPAPVPAPQTVAPQPVSTSQPVLAPQTVTAPQQPALPVMPPLIAVPPLEIDAEDRPAAPPSRQSTAKGKSRLAFLRRKKAEVMPEEKEAPGGEEPLEIPAKKGIWKRFSGKPRQAAEHHKRTAREKRISRRRRRVWLEELLGWVFVPVILIAIYWGVLGILALLGTTPEAMIAGLKLILSHF